MERLVGENFHPLEIFRVSRAYERTFLAFKSLTEVDETDGKRIYYSSISSRFFPLDECPGRQGKYFSEYFAMVEKTAGREGREKERTILKCR